MEGRPERALLNRRGPAQLALGFGVLALLLRGSLQSQLFGVQAADLRVIAGVTLLLGVVAPAE